jgi:hypothetical protein
MGQAPRRTRRYLGWADRLVDDLSDPDVDRQVVEFKAATPRTT